MKHAVIFDIDGTLLHSSDDDDVMYRDAVRQVLGNVTLRASLHDYFPVSDAAILAQILADNGMPHDDDVFLSVKNAFIELTRAFVERSPFKEVDGARSFVDSLRRVDNFSIGIATGGWQQSARLKLLTAGFVIDDIPLMSSDDASERTEIMRLALQSLGDGFESITYYGDGPWDRQACAELDWGFRAVGPMVDGIQSFDCELNYFGIT